jgi:hypothetical protein
MSNMWFRNRMISMVAKNTKTCLIELDWLVHCELFSIFIEVWKLSLICVDL